MNEINAVNKGVKKRWEKGKGKWEKAIFFNARSQHDYYKIYMSLLNTVFFTADFEELKCSIALKISVRPEK